MYNVVFEFLKYQTEQPSSVYEKFNLIEKSILFNRKNIAPK